MKKSSFNIFDTDRAATGLVALAVNADNAQGEAIALAGQFTKTLSNAVGAAYCAGGQTLVQELLTAVLDGYMNELVERHAAKAEITACLKNRIGKPLSRMSGTDRLSGLFAGLSIKENRVTVSDTREGAGIKAPRGASQAPVTAASSAPTVADVMVAVGSLNQNQLVELVQGVVRDHASVETGRELASWIAKRVKLPQYKRVPRPIIARETPPAPESAPVPVQSISAGAPLRANGQ